MERTISLVSDGEVDTRTFVSRTVVSYDCLVALFQQRKWCVQDGATYASHLAPTYPPKPMEIAPAVNSANPPRMTTLVLPRADRLDARAKGTVRPSLRPKIASDTILGFILEEELLLFVLCDETDSFSGAMC